MTSWIPAAGKSVYICGIGARTPVGLNAAASAAAVRCAISALGEHPNFIDKMDEPILLARDAELDCRLDVFSRIEKMLVYATTEAIGNILEIKKSLRLKFCLGLPEPRAGLPADISYRIKSVVSELLDISAESIRVLQAGHASGLMAMQAAAQIISSAEADFCIAAGVDSYHDQDSLEWLDKDGMLLSSENRNGFPPGEAAGVCLLTNSAALSRHRLPILSEIKAATTTIETKSIRKEEVCTGEGLTAAINGVISVLQLPRQLITGTYCDLNGERYRNEEFAYTILRTQQAFVDAHDYQCPADCWGDVGAASGPLFASLAIIASQRGYATGRLPILWAGSESGYRSAVILNLKQTRKAIKSD